MNQVDFNDWLLEEDKEILCPDCSISEITISNSTESHTVILNTQDSDYRWLNDIIEYR